MMVAELGAAWCLGLIFVGGGLSKLMPFPGVMGPIWLEEELAVYGLGMFARFIAWSEALIGLCLLAKQTRVLGAIMMVPLLLNILLVTVSMGWKGTPRVIMIFLSTNIFLLAYHFERWQPIIDWSTNWLHCNSLERAKFSKYVTILSIGLILAGPILSQWNWTFSMLRIVIGFFNLVIGECITRFTYERPNVNEYTGAKV